jgi:hypothetical protein
VLHDDYKYKCKHGEAPKMNRNTLKNIFLATTALVALSVSPGLANNITFDQVDAVGISNLNLEQAPSGLGNVLNVDVTGDITSINFEQSEGLLSTSSGNIANIDFYMNSTATTFDGSVGATREDSWKTFNATQGGDNNELTFTLGTSSDATYYSSVDVNVEVTGDNNDLTYAITNGLAEDSLQIDGTVNGDNNIVFATLGAAGDIIFNYDIQGNNNEYTSTIAGPASGGRTVDVDIDGNFNEWNVTANSSGGILDVASTGDYVTGTHTQNGAGAELQMDINKLGADALAVTTTQTGAAYADVTINAANGGAFTLTQTGASYYAGTLYIAAGGAVTITQ